MTTMNDQLVPRLPHNLTIAQFRDLSAAPPETEWFANPGLFSAKTCQGRCIQARNRNQITGQGKKAATVFLNGPV